MTRPAGCKTPKKNRSTYSLTASDIRFMEKALNKIDEMLGYYTNMPENRTGGLTVTERNFDRLNKLSETMELLVYALNDVEII